MKPLLTLICCLSLAGAVFAQTDDQVRASFAKSQAESKKQQEENATANTGGKAGKGDKNKNAGNNNAQAGATNNAGGKAGKGNKTKNAGSLNNTANNPDGGFTNTNAGKVGKGNKGKNAGSFNNANAAGTNNNVGKTGKGKNAAGGTNLQNAGNANQTGNAIPKATVAPVNKVARQTGSIGNTGTAGNAGNTGDANSGARTWTNQVHAAPTGAGTTGNANFDAALKANGPPNAIKSGSAGNAGNAGTGTNAANVEAEGRQKVGTVGGQTNAGAGAGTAAQLKDENGNLIIDQRAGTNTNQTVKDANAAGVKTNANAGNTQGGWTNPLDGPAYNQGNPVKDLHGNPITDPNKVNGADAPVLGNAQNQTTVTAEKAIFDKNGLPQNDAAANLMNNANSPWKLQVKGDGTDVMPTDPALRKSLEADAAKGGVSPETLFNNYKNQIAGTKAVNANPTTVTTVTANKGIFDKNGQPMNDAARNLNAANAGNVNQTTVTAQKAIFDTQGNPLNDAARNLNAANAGNAGNVGNAGNAANGGNIANGGINNQGANANNGGNFVPKHKKPINGGSWNNGKFNHRHFELVAGPSANVVGVTFVAGNRIPNSQNWSSPKYGVYRNYKSEWHDHNWWQQHHGTTIVLINGGYYYRTGNYWYPAWGYDRSANYYPYDGPIYAARNLTPDQVVANVQTALQELGYYQDGEVDGLLGPKTRAALAQYQADNGLAPTESVDQPTLESLGMT
jgi:hypothetical protein